MVNKAFISPKFRTRFREWCYSIFYEQTGTKAKDIHSHHCLYCDTTFPQFNALIKHSRENHPYHCYYCKTTFVLHSMRAIQRETERNSGLGSKVKLIVILWHIIAYFSINIRWHSQIVSSDSRKWLIKHLFPPSSWMLQHDDPVLFQKKLRTNRNQSLYFLWNNIEIMAFVTIMSTRWILMTRFCSKKIYEQTGTKATEIHSHHCLYCDTTFPQFDDLIKHSRENHLYHCYYCKTTREWCYSMMTRFCSKKNYEQTGTKAFIFSGITLKLWLL
jgi:ferredoxin-like protein FixX